MFFLLPDITKIAASDLKNKLQAGLLERKKKTGWDFFVLDLCTQCVCVCVCVCEVKGAIVASQNMY